MAHAQKLDLVFQRNGRVHLNRRGGQFSRLLADELCASAVVMVVTMDTPCSEVECKTTGYPLHSPVSPSLPPEPPCVTVCHQVSTELYLPAPHSVCTEHPSGHVSGGRGGLCSVTIQHCWKYSLLHIMLSCATPIGSIHYLLPLATFCWVPLTSYRVVSALCDRIVSV